MLGAGSLTLIAGIGAVALAEYAETGYCYRTGTILNTEELHERAIRSLITEELKAAERG